MLAPAAPRAQALGLVARTYPWALPIIAIARIAEPEPARVTVAMRGSIGGMLVAAAMCRTLSRREWR